MTQCCFFLRCRPQFCGQRGHIQEMLLLYMFITLPWKNKKAEPQAFPQFPSLSPPVTSPSLRGREAASVQMRAEHMSHFIIFRNRGSNFFFFSFLPACIHNHKLLSPPRLSFPKLFVASHAALTSAVVLFTPNAD